MGLMLDAANISLHGQSRAGATVGSSPFSPQLPRAISGSSWLVDVMSNPVKPHPL